MTTFRDTVKRCRSSTFLGEFDAGIGRNHTTSLPMGDEPELTLNDFGYIMSKKYEKVRRNMKQYMVVHDSICVYVTIYILLSLYIYIHTWIHANVGETYQGGSHIDHPIVTIVAALGRTFRTLFTRHYVLMLRLVSEIQMTKLRVTMGRIRQEYIPTSQRSVKVSA